MRLSDAFEYFDKKDDGSISFEEVSVGNEIEISSEMLWCCLLYPSMCRRWDALMTVAADDLRLEREHSPALESLSAVDCRKEA